MFLDCLSNLLCMTGSLFGSGARTDWLSATFAGHGHDPVYFSQKHTQNLSGNGNEFDYWT